MTRRDYKVLAAALNSIRPVPGLEGFYLHAAYKTWWGVVRTIADVCESDNDRFDRGLFIKACEGN